MDAFLQLLLRESYNVILTTENPITLHVSSASCLPEVALLVVIDSPMLLRILVVDIWQHLRLLLWQKWTIQYTMLPCSKLRIYTFHHWNLIAYLLTEMGRTKAN